MGRMLRRLVLGAFLGMLLGQFFRQRARHGQRSHSNPGWSERRWDRGHHERGPR